MDLNQNIYYLEFHQGNDYLCKKVLDYDNKRQNN